MDAFLGNLIHSNSVGKILLMFDLFVTTTQIEKYEAAEIMGTFTF